MKERDPIYVGDEFVDNDPRMARRALTVVGLLPNGAVLEDGRGIRRAYLRRRLHTDGKLRRTGLSRIYCAAHSQRAAHSSTGGHSE